MPNEVPGAVPVNVRLTNKGNVAVAGASSLT